MKNLTIQIDNKTYTVEWWYNKLRTLCLITCDDKLVGLGECEYSNKDNYSKPEGNKISLQRALELFSKDTRKIFWQEFLKKYQPPEKKDILKLGKYSFVLNAIPELKDSKNYTINTIHDVLEQQTRLKECKAELEKILGKYPIFKVTVK